jgi:hypothetical protein
LNLLSNLRNKSLCDFWYKCAKIKTQIHISGFGLLVRVLVGEVEAKEDGKLGRKIGRLKA